MPGELQRSRGGPRSCVMSVLVVAALVGTLLAAPLAVAARIDAAPAARFTPPRLVPTAVVPGERARLSGKLRPAQRRWVELQRRTERGWRSVDRERTKASGAYTFSVTTEWAPARLRVVAPAARRPVARRLVSASVRLGALRQTAQIVGPGSVTVGSAASVTATFGPVRRGRPVVLQAASGSAWAGTTAGTVGRTGRVRFVVPTVAPGSVRYRVTARAWRGAPAVSTSATVVTVSAATPPSPVQEQHLGVTMRLPGEDPLSGTVVFVADAAEAAEEVELFVDGESIGDAVRRDDGSWALTWDSADVADGDHSIAAVARGDNSRGVSTSVQVEVEQPTGIVTTGLPAGFTIETITSGLALPTALVLVDDDTQLVAVKAGQVYRVVDGHRIPTPLIDIGDHVGTMDDRGLIGLQIAPDFDASTGSGWVYLAYVYLGPGQDQSDFGLTQRVTRIRLDNWAADPAGEDVVVGAVSTIGCGVVDRSEPVAEDCIPQLGRAHTIDDLVFGPDGDLYISIGDGVLYYSAEPRFENLRAQNPDVLAGKILRVDPVTGRGVPGNPYFDEEHPTANRNRVYALGFRNPFRMSFDPTGQLIVGDVGEGNWEEVDIVHAGGNYGWPCIEGDQAWPAYDGMCTGPFVGPVHTYPHAGAAGAAGSITGGLTYTGDLFPESYRGRYFYGDYNFGLIRTVDLDAPDVDGSLEDLADPRTAGGPVQFRQASDGSLWFVSVYPGEVRRIGYDSSGSACADHTWRADWFVGPSTEGEPARVTCEPGPSLITQAPGTLPDSPDGYSVRLTGRPSVDGGTWDLVNHAADPVVVSVDGTTLLDGDRSSGEVRLEPGVHTVVYELSWDAGGSPATDVRWARSGSAPVVDLRSPASGVRWASGEQIPFEVTATDAEDGVLDGASVQVEVSLLHYSSDHPHRHPVVSETGTLGSFALDDAHAPGASAFELVASATDASGWTTRTPPVYVCLDDNVVGVCG